MSSAVVSSAALVRADGASARGAASGTSKAAPPPNAFASRVLRRRRGGGADLATPPSRGRCASIRTQVAERNPNVVDVDEDELRYREMMRITKEWMAYDPDDVPESTPAPWETHIRELMQNGPWPCWNADLPESHFEPEPEFVPFETAPEAYSAFDDKAKLWREKVFVERARVTAKRQAEIRSRNWMQMDRDIRLADIPSCVEAGWSHDKILNLIAYPEHVQQAMESYSVHIYDPRFPIDNTWIEPPAPDTCVLRFPNPDTPFSLAPGRVHY